MMLLVGGLKMSLRLLPGAGENSIVPLELRVALGSCSFIPPGWILIGVFLIIFFAYPAWKEASLFMPHLGGY